VARSIVTVWTKSGSFSFLSSDLEQGPILAPEHGFFVRATKVCPVEAVGTATKETNSRKLLDHKIDHVLGNKDIRGWTAGSDTPWFAGNATEHPATVSGITVPGRGVAMHPGADHDVGVGWRRPMDGRVSVAGNVAHAQPADGDGIEWSVVSEGRGGRTVLAIYSSRLPSSNASVTCS